MKWPGKKNRDEEPEEKTTGETRREKMITQIETGSHQAPSQGDLVLASAITQLAKEAKNAVDATEKAANRTKTMTRAFVGVGVIVVLATIDQRWMAQDVQRGVDIVEIQMADSAKRQEKMEDILNKVANAVVAEINAELAEEEAEIDELLTGEEEEEPTGTYRHNEARKILKASKDAATKKERSKKVATARMEAQSHAIAAQHSITIKIDPKLAEKHAEKFMELQKQAKKADIKFPDLELEKALPPPKKEKK